MATHKLDPEALRRFLEADRSQAQAARHFGVSEAAISQQVRKLRLATSKIVALEKASVLVEEKLSASAQLAHAQRVILEQLKRGGADDSARRRSGQTDRHHRQADHGGQTRVDLAGEPHAYALGPEPHPTVSRHGAGRGPQRGP